jgi:Tfp pilus assembly protein PilP
MRFLSVVAILIVGGVGLSNAADTKTSAPVTSAAPAAPVPAVAVAPVSVAGFAAPGSSPYAYSADGRRDPFQNLAGTGGDSKTPPKPPAAGIAGIRVEDLSVRGIMQSRDQLVAMIQGPDSRTYLIHQGDKLADGAVKSITPQGLVMVQDVTDPRAKDKTREVRKALRASEDDKE